MTVFYYVGLFLCGASNAFATQKYGRSNRTYQSIFIYALVTGVMAMGVFWTMTGFALELNARAVQYAMIYAVVVLASYFTRLPAYRHLGVAEVGLISSGGSLVLSMLAGALLFGERLTLVSVLRMALMLASLFFLFLDRKSHAPKKTGEGKKAIGALLGLGLVAVGVVSGICSKYIAIDPLVPDANSLFFMTNVFTSSAALICLPLLCKGKVRAIGAEFVSIAPVQYLMILISTVASNIQSLLAVLILAEDAFTLYVPLSGALGILATEAVAVLLVRERPRIIPVLLACGAMLLAFFE